MALQDLISEVIGALGSNTVVQRNNLQQQGALQDEIISRMQETIPDAVAVNQQKLQGDLQAQQNAIATRQALGNDINDPNSILGIMVQDFRESALAARNQRAAVAQMDQVGLFDDPLQYMVNQVLRPGEIRKLNAAESQLAASASTIGKMQELTTASAQAQRATAETLSKLSIEQSARVQKADLDNKITALQMEKLGTDYKSIELLNHNNAQHMQFALQAHSAALQDAAALRASEMHQRQMESLDKEKLDEAQYLGILNRGAQMYELPQLSIESVRLMQKSPEQKAKLDKLFSAGYELAVTGVNSVGSSPGEAIMNTLDVGGLRGAQNKPTRDFLSKVAREAFSDYEAKNGKVPKMTPAVRAAIAEGINDKLYGPVNPKTGKRMTNQGESYKMALNSESPTSIFKAPDLAQLVTLPAVRSNVLFETVLKPAVAAGVVSSSPEQLYGLADAARAKGLINDKQLAMGIADLYKASTVATYASSGAGKFNLPYHPSYLAEVPSVFSPDPSAKDRIDWAKEESVLSYDIARRARMAYSSAYRTMATGSPVIGR